MPLADHLAELEPIARLITQEHELIHCLRCQGEPPEPEAEARAYAAGLAQMALMIRPLQMAALDLELEASWVA